MRRSLLRELRRLMPPRPLQFAEAVRIAELQATRLLTLCGVTEPPVPSDVVTKFPRVQVESIYPLGVSGAAAWSEGRWQIILNAGEPVVRQRFSAAHELKHIIDHPFAMIAYPARFGMTSAERREQVADYFANCALMPRRWVQRAWGNGIQDIGKLARMFDVSRESMCYRLTALGLLEPKTRCEVGA